MASVMFTAVADEGGNIGPYDGDTTVIFRKVITNIGGGYDNTSGIFTAPYAGYYYFSFFYRAGKELQSGLTLMKNSTVIVKAFDNKPPSVHSIDNAGNAACLELQAGDQVFVILPAKHQVWGANNCTTFSGFLIKQM
uniref:complement C1q-like protein 4 n=1 Tax=Scatophagus argus TaxID=75038 RepID=UPI001ED7D76F|nr:complement C1q-like protein 4 [Scatophagus argus]